MAIPAPMCFIKKAASISTARTAQRCLTAGRRQ
jgi:hypothetical protein